MIVLISFVLENPSETGRVVDIKSCRKKNNTLNGNLSGVSKLDEKDETRRKKTG